MISAHLLQAILALLNARKCKVLTVAQAALPEHQFKAFKSLFLDEFGKNGLESQLVKLLNEGNHPVEHRQGQE